MKRASSTIKLVFALIAVGLSTGCRSVWNVPPANGRIVDALSRQPIANAKVTQLCGGAANETKSDANGNFTFRGESTLEIDFGDHFTPPASYQIEAVGYQGFQTNWLPYGHDFAEIQLVPK